MSGARVIGRQHQNVADKPFLVIWESTRACPLACLHCRAEAVPDACPIAIRVSWTPPQPRI
ncbi:hypothetical protein AB0E27_27905 [Streptomyces sparsogenes]|uniref:hypothetical protein n=1 Tax=Streptomyces sparsogenes TaxID=67365 RepID=UPI0033DC1AC9